MATKVVGHIVEQVAILCEETLWKLYNIAAFVDRNGDLRDDWLLK